MEKNPWMIMSVILTVIVISSMYVNFSLSNNVISVLNSRQTGSPSAANQPTIGNPSVPSVRQQQFPEPQPIVDTNSLIDDDPVLGKADAPVTIVAFEDYQCPFCGRFHEQTFSQIKSEYIDTGKVKFVFRDFPLSFHTYAQKAHEAANCAGEQGKYFEYGEILFKNQEALGEPDLKNYAKQLGLNQQQFDSCLDSGKHAQEIQKDVSDGSIAGVSGTPSFFVNGRQISGAQPFSSFKAAIEASL